MIDMLFLTRLKVLLRRKETLFWVLIFPLLLATAEYLAFGNFVHSTPIETITIGMVTEEEFKLEEIYFDVFKEAELEEMKFFFIYFAQKIRFRWRPRRTLLS